jgi:hypothetical protein
MATAVSMHTRATPMPTTEACKVDDVPAPLAPAIGRRPPSMLMRWPWMLYRYPCLRMAATSARRNAAADGQDQKGSLQEVHRGSDRGR